LEHLIGWLIWWPINNLAWIGNKQTDRAQRKAAALARFYEANPDYGKEEQEGKSNPKHLKII
jgi:hypothetical protein